MNGVPTTELETKALRRLRPQSTASRLPFLLGSAGHFLAAALSVPLWFAAVRGDLFLYYARSEGLILSTLFAVTLLLASTGIYGLWRNYGSKFSACAFGCGVVASLFLLITGLVASGACAYRAEYHVCYRSLPDPYNALVAASYLLLGIAFITYGCSFLKLQRCTREPENASTTGELYIIAGCFFASILGALLAGFLILMVAFIYGGVVLARAPITPSAVVRIAPPAPPAEA